MSANGYNQSIIQPDFEYPRCYLCGKSAGKLDRHEIFGGASRPKSKRYGLWVHLCHAPCHLQDAHGDRATALILKKAGQRAAMERYHWDISRFVAEFGKNYLEI